MSAKEARVLGARSMATQACGLGDAKDKSGLAQNLQRVGILVPVAMPSHPWSAGNSLELRNIETLKLRNSGAAITKVKVVKSSRLKMQMPGIEDCGLRQVRPPPLASFTPFGPVFGHLDIG